MTESESVVAVEPTTDPVGAPVTEAIGEPVTEEDKAWAKVAELLTPEKTIGRNEERAKFVVSTVTVVGTLITGLGLVLGARVTSTFLGRTLAGISVGLAASAVALSVACLVVGGAHVLSPGDTMQVQRWYKGQQRRGTIVGVAGILLVLSVALGAVAAGMTMAGIVSGQPNLTATITSDKGNWDISAQGKIDGLNPQDGISITLTGIRQGRSSVKLAQQVSRAGSQGNVSVSLAVKALRGFVNYRFDLSAPNLFCSARLTPTPVVKKSIREFVCSKS
jgi:uncharacterized membrane protein